jgi:hypothetical protein
MPEGTCATTRSLDVGRFSSGILRRLRIPARSLADRLSPCVVAPGTGDAEGDLRDHAISGRRSVLVWDPSQAQDDGRGEVLKQRRTSTSRVGVQP